MEVASREIIREAVVQGLGIAAVSEVEYVAGAGLACVPHQRCRDPDLCATWCARLEKTDVARLITDVL
jgi:DNA-binding transcriptional LysR family regulator